MDRHKRLLKSVYKELGWGRAKHGIDRRRKPKAHKKYQLRLQCPRCDETDSENVTELRDGYWWCRKCGYEDDVDNWLEN